MSTLDVSILGRVTDSQRDIVLRAYANAQRVVTCDVAAGRTPDSLPIVGATPRARRCMITARKLAKNGDVSPSVAAQVWALYTAAMLADESGDVSALLTATLGPKKQVDPLVVVDVARRRRRVRRCTPGGRPCCVVADLAASNAPPAVVERMNAADT